MLNMDKLAENWPSDQLSLKEFLYPIKSSGAGVLHFTLEIVPLKVNQWKELIIVKLREREREEKGQAGVGY